MSASSTDPYREIYRQGRAIGQAEIKTDTVTLRFKDEVFSLPIIEAWEIVRWNGYFWEADIDDVRRLVATRN